MLTYVVSSLKNWLHKVFTHQSGRPSKPVFLEDLPPGLKIDLGCGAHKKPGTLGVDIQAGPGVDYVLDMEAQPLPFRDRSVAYVHTSHFLEHVHDPVRILSEIGRVCCNGARLEIWLPYGGHGEAFIYGHERVFFEDHFLHPCVLYPEHWEKILDGRWILSEIHYVVKPQALCELRQKQISLDFALRYSRNVATEFCAYITVWRDQRQLEAPPVRRTFSTGRFEPRHEIRVEPLEVTPQTLDETLKFFSTANPPPVSPYKW